MAGSEHPPRAARPFGFLNVFKPLECTSHRAVAAVRRRVPQGTKVGHAGTLDPLATGVLVICVGPATRLAEYVQPRPKRYRTVIALGATSTTDDREGAIEPVAEARPAPADRVEAFLNRFVGRLDQTPPSHSAVHVGGHRAYKLARRGECPELAARPVTIHHIGLLRYEWPELEIEVCCGAGTYIRALARDIGAELGVGGYCAELKRTAVGPFTLDDAVDLAEADPARHLTSPLAALDDVAQIELDDARIEKVAMGQAVSIGADLPEPGKSIAILDRAGRLAAIGHVRTDGQSVRPDKVFVRPGDHVN